MRRLLIGITLLAALTGGCATGGGSTPGTPAPPPPPAVPAERHVRITVLPSTAAAGGELVMDDGQRFAGVLEAPGRVRFDVSAAASYDVGGTIQIRAEGFSAGTRRHLLTREGDQEADGAVVLEATRRARRGIVRLAGRTFVDDDGPFLAIGASCFWCPWAYEHDRARLAANLACVAGLAPDVANCPRTGGADYLRVLLVVGPSGGWDDRIGDARQASTFERLAGLADLAFGQYGIRLELTIFGGVDSAPTPGERETVVRRVADIINARPAAFQFVEVANEGNLNGFGGQAGRDELARLAGILRASTPALVALTSPQGEDWAAYYAGTPATIATAHLERDTNGTGGAWRPVRQARELVGFPTGAWTSNEPIGPQSSVAADDDPTRLVMAAGLTWLCNGAGYVYHTGAGIRGGGAADLARGRAANFAEVAHFRTTLEGLAALRAKLPADLPNWTWHNANNRFPAYPFELPYDDNGTKLLASEDDVLRAFAAIAGDRFVVMPIKVDRAVRFTARRAMTFEVLEPLSGQVLEAVTLNQGQSFTLTPRGAAVFVGRFI